MSATNEVRVFLCSTFADFELERRLVHEEAVPLLREVCAHYGLRFSLSDLRYGVTERDATAARTNELCLLEISNCARISPELHCLCLLGHRYGSRVLPRELQTHGLQSLLSSLHPELPAHARTRQLLTRIYDLERAGTRVRSATSSQDAADEFLKDAEVMAALQSVAVPDPAGEAARSALGFSITHQELFLAGALSDAGGVVTVLRNAARVQSGTNAAPPLPRGWSDRFIDEGPARAAQERLRAAAGANPSAKVVTLEMPVMDDGQIPKEYADRFKKAVLSPLHERVLRARARGTRLHRFVGLAQPAPSDAAETLDDVESQALDRWLYDSSPGSLAVVAETGAHRAGLLARLESKARARGHRQVIRLDATTHPELGDYRNFALAVLAALGDLQDARSIGDLEGMELLELGARLMGALARSAENAPLLLIVNGLDLLRTAGRTSLHGLWRGVPGLRFACGCEAGYSLLATYAQRSCTVAVSDRTPQECERFIAGAVRRGGLVLPMVDLAAMVAAAATRPTPEYLTALVDAYVASEGDPSAGWSRTSPEEFREARLQHLVESAPFPPEVCRAFLGLLAAAPLGAAEQDFLRSSAQWPAVHQAIVASFAAPPSSREVPALVWLRLRSHFKDVLESIGLFDDVIHRPKAPDRVAIINLVGQDLLRECAARFTEQLWLERESPPARVALQLPGLLAGAPDLERLGALFQLRGFTKKAYELDHGRTLIEAWQSQEGHEEVSPVVVDMLPPSSSASVQETTHWLLDLAVILRSMGHAAESAKAAHRALDLRQKALPAGTPPIVVAALQASDSYLEAGEYETAQRIAEDILGMSDALGDDSDIVQRLRMNLAAAYGYQGDFEKALPIHLRQAASAEARSSPSDAATIHGGLAACYREMGELEKALEHSDRCIDMTTLAYGEDSERLGPPLFNRGAIFLSREEPREAATCFERALEIYDRRLDRHHPWRVNAALGAVEALVSAGEQSRALKRLAAEASDTRVFTLWSFPALELVLDGMDVEPTATADVLRKLAASLRSELQPGVARSSRAQEKLGSFTSGTTRGIQLSRAAARRANMLIGAYRWLYVYLEAAARELISRDETLALLRDVDRFLLERLDPPESLRDFDHRAPVAWSTIEQCAYTEERLRLFRGLIAEVTGAATRMPGKVEGSDEELARSIQLLELQLSTAEARQPPDENEAGQLCILLSTKYAAVGRFEEAISSQRQAVAIAERLFGKRSKLYWKTVINLGSILRQAGRAAEAFANYQAGLRQMATFNDVLAAELWGSLEKALALAWEMEEFRAAADLLEVFDGPFFEQGYGVQSSLMAVRAWVNAGRTDLGIQKLQRAIDALVKMRADLPGWIRMTIVPTAIHLMGLDLKAQDRDALFGVIAALRQTAREHHLAEQLSADEGWLKLMRALDGQKREDT